MENAFFIWCPDVDFEESIDKRLMHAIPAMLAPTIEASHCFQNTAIQARSKKPVLRHVQDGDALGKALSPRPNQDAKTRKCNDGQAHRNET